MAGVEGKSGHQTIEARYPLVTQTGSRPRAMVRLVVSNSGHPFGPNVRRSSSGSDASRVDRAVRGDVVDFAARGTDVH